METAQFAILAGLSAISVAICVYLLLKVRTVTYLLEQPVVKKMSPQLKLKPVKIDELDGESRPNPSRNQNANGTAPRAPRPAFEGGERPPRDQAAPAREGQNRDRDRGPRPERTESGERPAREGAREGGFDRGPRPERSDRGDRGDRFGGREGGRDRGGRGHDRHERGDRGDRFGGREGGRDRNRTEAVGGEREPAHAEPGRPAHVHSESTPAAATPTALAPRRPLPSTVDNEVEHKEIPAPDSAAAAAAAEDALFARDESDMQHGRRNQMKKKPRFEVAEEEAKTTEESKA